MRITTQNLSKLRVNTTALQGLVTYIPNKECNLKVSFSKYKFETKSNSHKKQHSKHVVRRYIRTYVHSNSCVLQAACEIITFESLRVAAYVSISSWM